MEPIPEINWSEIISQPNESWAFVDSNIFETVREEAEVAKRTLETERWKVSTNEHIKEINEEVVYNNYQQSADN